MPSFTFQVHDPVSRPSACMVELVDLHAARAEVLRFAGEMIKDMAGRVRSERRLHIDVANEAGLKVIQLEFAMVETLAAKLVTSA